MTTIEWTDETWNPLVGCKAVSPGCDHCYAATLASGRLKTTPPYVGLAEKGVFTGEVRTLPDRLDQPLHWRTPRRVFVNSMSDLFHPSVGSAFIAQVFDVMARCPQHSFQILTKRPQRMEKLMRTGVPGERWPLPNVWLGTSIESDRYTFRGVRLRDTRASVRFLSLEPLLGPLPSLSLKGIDWVIVGGESGRDARPMHPDWARSIRDRCWAAGVPFLFKQWGKWAPEEELDLQGSEDHNRFTIEPLWYKTWEGIEVICWRGKVPFRTLDGRLHDEYPA